VSSTLGNTLTRKSEKSVNIGKDRNIPAIPWHPSNSRVGRPRGVAINSPEVGRGRQRGYDWQVPRSHGVIAGNLLGLLGIPEIQDSYNPPLGVLGAK